MSPATIVASGFSSGGCFATQFHTAFSASVAGVGVFSGCPYLSGAVGFNVRHRVSSRAVTGPCTTLTGPGMTR